MHVCCVVLALKKRNSWLSAASRFYPLATIHRDLKIIYCAYTGIELLARLIGSISIIIRVPPLRYIMWTSLCWVLHTVGTRIRFHSKLLVSVLNNSSWSSKLQAHFVWWNYFEGLQHTRQIVIYCQLSALFVCFGVLVLSSSNLEKSTRRKILRCHAETTIPLNRTISQLETYHPTKPHI